MPSPFPGMDPYLENPALFPAVHQSLITYLWDELNTKLPPHYVANIGERVFITGIGDHEQPIYPDVFIVQYPNAGHDGSSESGVAVAEAPPLVSDEPYRVTNLSDERREVFIEIVPIADESQVITLIEVLSPANKAYGNRGHKTYVEKQQSILESDTHLIEIDLLRGGLHTVAVSEESLRVRGVFDYRVCLHRASASSQFDVWAFTVRQRFPRFAIPLGPEDADLVVDLQTLFNRCYDAGNFARRINYQNEPPMPWRATDTAWADAILREKGLRPVQT